MPADTGETSNPSADQAALGIRQPSPATAGDEGGFWFRYDHSLIGDYHRCETYYQDRTGPDDEYWTDARYAEAEAAGLFLRHV